MRKGVPFVAEHLFMFTDSLIDRFPGRFRWRAVAAGARTRSYFFAMVKRQMEDKQKSRYP